MHLPGEVRNPSINHSSMAFDFDSCPDRSVSDSTKWNKYAGRDVIPAWIADMDFRSAPPIVEALRARAEPQPRRRASSP